MTVRRLLMGPLSWGTVAATACGGSGSGGATAAADSAVADGQTSAIVGDSAATDALVLQIGDGSFGAEAGVFDCALAVTGNCWRTTALAAAGCLPPASERGTLSSDRLTCTYASGTVIRFASPVTAPPSSPIPGFTVTANGTQCVSAVMASNGSMLTTSAGSVSLVYSSSGGVTLACPDGATYVGAAAALDACEPGTLPGYVEGGGGTLTADGGEGADLVLSLEDTLSNNIDGLQVFDCVTP